MGHDRGPANSDPREENSPNDATSGSAVPRRVTRIAPRRSSRDRVATTTPHDDRGPAIGEKSSGGF